MLGRIKEEAMSFVYAIEQYFELISTYPFVLQVALYFIFFNSLTAIIFVASIYLIRGRKDKEERIEEELYPKQKKFLLQNLAEDDILTGENVLAEYVEQIGKLNNRTYLPLITAFEDIVKRNNDVTNNKNYRSIVKGLKIEEYLIKKLDFSNTRSRLRTFQSIAILGLTVPDSSILPHTYSKNPFLRKESRNSYLAISNHDPFKFFDQQDNNLNHWDQINLLEQLESHHRHNLPNFSKWIQYSKNNSQLSFIIKAVSYFNQKISIPALILLVDTEDHEIRKEAIIALGEMRVQEVEDKIKMIYHHQPVICQNAIVEAISFIASGESLNFLKGIYAGANNLDSKKLIAEVIYKYNTEGQQHIEKLYRFEDGFNKLILDHIKNPLIPSRLRSVKRTNSESSVNINHLNFSI
ncbi:MAG: HEAT repeat domain-containing protein [Flavobacteriales bacterium]|nr:MAG: HEAT repeat domain-containing protein [Flavobacteriales bacterium]